MIFQHNIIKSFIVISIIGILCLIPGCSRKLPPEAKAIEMVKHSHALGGDRSVEVFIETWLREKGDEVKPMGWEVEAEGKYLYLVSYRYELHSFKLGIGQRAYFFRVNLNTGTVRDVTGEFRRKMKPLAPPFSSEKEATEKIFENLYGEKEMLGGRSAP